MHVLFKIWVSHDGFYAVFDERVIDLYHQETIQTFATVFIFDPNQIKISDVIFPHSAQEVQESEGEKVPFGFLQRLREGWEGNTEGNHAIFFIQQNGNEFWDGKPEIGINIKLHLGFAEWYSAVEFSIRLIEYFE